MILKRKLYARADYKGLTGSQADALRKSRSSYAAELREVKAAARKSNKMGAGLLADKSGKLAGDSTVTANITGPRVGSGRSSYSVSTVAKAGESSKDLVKRSNKNVNEILLGNLKSDKKALRETVIADTKRGEFITGNNKTAKEISKKVTKSGSKVAPKANPASKVASTGGKLKLGKGGKIALGVAGTAALGYGAKKLYDSKKSLKK